MDDWSFSDPTLAKLPMDHELENFVRRNVPKVIFSQVRPTPFLKERKLVAQLSLKILQDGVLLHQLLNGQPGGLHVAAVPAVDPLDVLAVLQESLAQPPGVLPAPLQLRQQALRERQLLGPSLLTLLAGVY